MIKKIAFILIGLIVLFFASIFVFRYIDNKNEIHKMIDRFDLTDHCINNIYINDYIGISVTCPNGLMAIERYDGYSTTPREGVSFIDKTKNIKNYNNLVNASKFTSFSIGVSHGKFDPNNYYDYSPFRTNTLNQVEALKFINNAEAVTGPQSIKVENIKKISIGGNDYYTYSRMVDSRTDYFFYVKEGGYIGFTFNNKSESYIKDVLSSVKIIAVNNFYSNKDLVGIKNLSIGLTNIDIPKEWILKNYDNSTELNYSGSKGTIKMYLSNIDTSPDEFMSKIVNYDKSYPNPRIFNTFILSFGCENPIAFEMEGTLSCGKYGDQFTKVYHYIKDKKIFTVVDIDSLAMKNLGLNSVERIINSIIESN